MIVSESDAFSFWVTNVSPTGVKAEVVNHAMETLYWGSEWTLEESIDGVWYELEIVPPEGVVVVSHDILFTLAGGQSRVLEFQWEGIIKELSEGSYRIVKEFYYDDRKREDAINVACEFRID